MWWCSSYLIKSIIQARCHAKHLLHPHRFNKSGHYKAQQCLPHLPPLDTNFPSLHASSQSPSCIYKHATSITPAMPLSICMYYGFLKDPTEHLGENIQLCCRARGCPLEEQSDETRQCTFSSSFLLDVHQEPTIYKRHFQGPRGCNLCS